ncbi:MAG: hypothetical protein GY708_09860 [Actinomycetia bacterium]|nr:hypothetical protein [Actinomycetes bacterium]MCP4957962.1 hypothetical protein [Actinomycetes bacterium]
MTQATEDGHSTRDQLLAQLELIQVRLDRFGDAVTDLAGDAREALLERKWFVVRRCEELRAGVEQGPEPETGVSSSVDDLSAATDTLDADLDAARESVAGGYRAAVDKQLRAWKGRIEQLRLQESLGEMELRDELSGAGERLAEVRGSVLADLRLVADDAGDVVDDLRDVVEDLMVEVRRTAQRASDALTK